MQAGVQHKRAVIGVISDTHGSVAKSAQVALVGVDLIVHAGDIMADDVIASLEKIAPVTAVRGNMDGFSRAHALCTTELAEIAGVFIYVIHDVTQLDLDPRSAGISIVIHGHTHKADIAWHNGILFLNPGSAAHPRGTRGASVARIILENGTISPEIVPL